MHNNFRLGVLPAARVLKWCRKMSVDKSWLMHLRLLFLVAAITHVLACQLDKTTHSATSSLEFSLLDCANKAKLTAGINVYTYKDGTCTLWHMKEDPNKTPTITARTTFKPGENKVENIGFIYTMTDCYSFSNS